MKRSKRRRQARLDQERYQELLAFYDARWKEGAASGVARPYEEPPYWEEFGILTLRLIRRVNERPANYYKRAMRQQLRNIRNGYPSE